MRAFRKVLTLVMVVLIALVLLYFGVSNLTALISYTPPLLSIVAIALGIFMIIVSVRTSHEE